MAGQQLILDSGFGSPYTDTLVWGSKWTYPPISYSFGSGLIPVRPGDPQVTGQAWTQEGINAFRTALQSFQNVCNISFQEETYSVSNLSNIALYQVGNSFWGGIPVTGEFEYPTGDYSSVYGFFNSERPNWSNLSVGGESFAVIIHELGHALGLAHPHNGGYMVDGYQFPGMTFNNSTSLGDYQMNQGIWTVMSYNHGWNQQPINGSTSGWQAGPMALDIAALQEIYGVNNSYKTGNDVYMLPGSSGLGVGWTCLWDAGGVDTISNAGSSSAVTIDLRAANLVGEHAGGYVSWVNGVSGGYTIANAVTIENAIGGGGDDSIVANNVANIINGGAGVDTVTFADDLSNYSIAYDQVNDLYSVRSLTHASDIDTISNIERFSFLNGMYLARSLVTNAPSHVDSEASGMLTVNGSYLTNQGTWSPVNIYAGTTIIAQLQGVVDPDGLISNTAYLWQAYYDNAWRDIPGGNINTLSIPVDEVGTKIRMVATTTDGLGGVTDFISDSFTIQSASNSTPTGSISISGSARQGRTLTATNTLADADGIATAITYQWLADGQVIMYATNPTLLLDSALVGKKISVVATYIDGLSWPEAMTSSETDLVEAPLSITYAIPVSAIQSIGLSPDGQFLLIKVEGVTQAVGTGSYLNFNGSTVTTTDLTQTMAPTPVFQSNGSVGGYTLPELFTGPASLNLQYQLIETADNAVVIGGTSNDFIKVASTNSTGKAVDGGAGSDVIDGGVGSTFITGGAGGDTFFLDGRAPGVSWSTITDFNTGSDKATIWGFVKGVSSVDASFTDPNNEGAPNYQGLTLHFKNLLPSGQTTGTNADLNSITLSGRTLADIGVSSLQDLNNQINKVTTANEYGQYVINDHLIIGQTQDAQGTHGYLFVY